MPADSDSPPILIRSDAGGTLGTGHVMRMIALGQAWQERGGNVTLCACQCPPPLVERLAKENIGFSPIGEYAPGSEQDLQATVALARSLSTRWIVLDGYQFGTDYQRSLKEAGFKVLAIDDYGHCETWNADLILNQNIRETRTHLSNGDKDPRFLNGPRYALLRREFRRNFNATPKSSAKTHVLITFGGVDPTQATLAILTALNRIELLDFSLLILAGPANPKLANLRDAIAASPHECELIAACDDMPALYSRADRVISAGGSSCYEWMLFGKPGWVTSVAENQDAIVRAMIHGRHAAGLEKISETAELALIRSLETWLKAPAENSCLPDLDGFGAPRTAAILAEDPCWIRPASPEQDAGFLFELANEPSVRSAGRHPQRITWEEHVAWLKRQCASPDSRLMILEATRSGTAGQIRFHRRKNSVWEIGISISPLHRKSGLAASALTLAMQSLKASTPVSKWLAEIHPENLASQRLFEKLGFHTAGENDGLQIWTLHSRIVTTQEP